MELTSKVALISGANKGIGFEIARQLGEMKIKVLIGARNEQAGNAATEQLKSEGIDAQVILLDLDQPATITAAQNFIQERFGKLDILLNNAAFQTLDQQLPSEITEYLLLQFMRTNYIAHVHVTQSLSPLLKQSEAGRIVNMSTSLGSITIMSDPGHVNARRNLLGYSSAKAALNMFTVLLAKELKPTKIKVNSADPGWTKTDLGGKDAIYTPEEGAKVAVWLACLDEQGATGGFLVNKF